MHVICKLKREGGTRASIGSENYHFTTHPEFKNGEHVADVINPKHLARFLAISEGYCLPGGEDEEIKPFDATEELPADADSQAGGDDSGDGNDSDDSDGVFDEPNASMYDMMEIPELAALVEQRTGQAPHHKTGKAKLIATLQSLNAA
jgi:hypothetical protein